MELTQTEGSQSVVYTFQKSVLNVPNLKMLDISVNPHMMEMIPPSSFSNLVWLNMLELELEESPKAFDESLLAMLGHCNFEII
ncbi:hypothetical protein WICPIJ_007214 [Wickerhamomyces pijperi]|uniref:Uncharacterized protein n=1 Tax=Wickerhamomyces pijperi TaxID=599730 RepID=A0A9P8Q0I0_WICPI|nr:hypothetical protein WICPIJ_007214 [Wickerhamomyces pijperi]